MTDQRPLNRDPVIVVNLRMLDGHNVEALLRVSAWDYDRLLADHAGMQYSIAPTKPEEQPDE